MKDVPIDEAIANLQKAGTTIEREEAAAEAAVAEEFAQVYVSERFVESNLEHLRFVHEGGWLCWNNGAWEKDELRPQFLAKEACKEAARRAHVVYAPAIARQVSMQLLKGNTVTAVLNIARSDPRITIRAAKLDANPWVLNCANGTLDLQTGRLREHRRDDLCTKRSPVAFDPDAPAPLWNAFLTRVLPDVDVRSFVQRLAGYALTGVIREHVLPIFWGKGRNGKGTFIETMMFVLGDYARTVPTSLLKSQDRGEAHPTTQAQLFGVRFAPAQETDKQFSLAEGLVKQLTGGDRISARYMRQDFFDFEPTHKLFMGTNNKPLIKGTDEGIWSRVQLIPWTAYIPENERDTELKNKLRAEAPGILAWAMQGCLAWQASGLAPPESVRVATQGFRQESDLVGRFLFERCVEDKNNIGLRVQASALYHAFEQWCRSQGEKAESQKAFGSALTDRSITRKGLNGRQWYVGLGLRAEAEQERGESPTPPTHEPISAVDGENGQVEDVDLVDDSRLSALRTHVHARVRETVNGESSTLSTSSTNESVRIRSSEDALEWFLENRCVFNGSEPLIVLGDAWTDFCLSTGCDPRSEQWLQKALADRGFDEEGETVLGLSLLPFEAPGAAERLS